MLCFRDSTLTAGLHLQPSEKDVPTPLNPTALLFELNLNPQPQKSPEPSKRNSRRPLAKQAEDAAVVAKPGRGHKLGDEPRKERLHLSLRGREYYYSL